ncbi:MAG: GGDEF domain-containing protein [Pseudomonadota bacterium]
MAHDQLLRQVADLRAENERLRELSLIDPLTGLHNYRYFQEQLEIEMERVRRTGAPCGLIMLDLDHFKLVNDNYGHEAGNTVLQEAAAVIKAGTRAMDIVCRYGGEEFAIILPSTTLEEGERIVERIRRALKRRKILYRETPIRVTISAGAACLRYLDPLTQVQFIELADAALYQAKHAGRDQVCSRLPENALPTEVGPAEKELLKK